MKTNTYLQQLKTNLFYGVRIGAVPILLLDILCALFLAIGLDDAMWDITFIDGVYISLLAIAHLILIALLGIISISAILSSNRKFSNSTVFIFGALVGVVLVAIGDYISFLFWQSYEFLPLPSIATILLLAYAGQKMNRRVNVDAERKSPELRATFGMTLIALIGSIAFVLTCSDYLGILDKYIYLGYALSISLPIAILAGFLIGILIKRIPMPTFLNWPIWQRTANAIRSVVVAIRKRIGSHPILKITAFTLLAFGFFYGTLYLKLTIPSDRELWRITQYSVSYPTVVNDLLLFHGYKVDRSVDCYCLYAVNKSTGKIVWSTEELAAPYIDASKKPDLNSSISFSVGTGLEMVSPTGDFLYVSLNYWVSEDAREDVLFAIRSSDGKVLWKVKGVIDTDSFSKSINEINRIFVVDNQGNLLAIDSNTGKELWRQNVYPYYDEDYSWFTYHNNLILVSMYSSECLQDCCTFKSDEQEYQQIAAFSAETGQPLWGTTRLDSGRIYVFNDTLYMVSEPWEKAFVAKEKMDDDLVTAIDLKTGKKRWELIFENAHELIVEANSQSKTFFFIKTYRGGPNDFHKLANIIVVDEFTGKPVWQFNESFAHGDLGHLMNGNLLYIGTKDGFVYSLDNNTGDVLWQTETGPFPVSFVMNGDALLAVYEERYVSAMDAETGQQKWKLDLGVDDAWSVLGDEILENNGDTFFIIGNNNQTIYAIDINTGNKLWTWNHFRPTRSTYEFGLLDDNTLYVSERTWWNFWDYFMPDYFVRNAWFFALKTGS